ncbi:MAG: hypothetical protein QM689_11700 [Oscillospiraceae bacterium]
MKKLISLTMAALLTAGVLLTELPGAGAKSALTASAATAVNETTAAHSTIATAQAVSSNTTINGTTQINGSYDYYQYSLPSSGKLTVTLKAYDSMSFRLYDATGNELDWEYVSLDTTVGFGTETFDYYLEPGTYNIGVYGYDAAAYTLTAAYAAITTNETERNDTIATAQTAVSGTTYTGIMAITDATDVYKVTLASPSKLQLDFTLFFSSAQLIIYDSKSAVVKDEYAFWDQAAGKATEQFSYYLERGTYYIAVYSAYQHGKYTLKATTSAVSGNDTEPNNTLAKAQAISVNKTYKGMLATTETDDYFKFTLTSAKHVTINCKSVIEGCDLYLLNSSGKKLESKYLYNDSTLGYDQISFEVSLAKGTYYLQFDSSYYDGTYSFEVSTKTNVSALTASYPPDMTYTGKVLKPTLIVKDGSTKLKAGTDYTLTYKNNTAVGVAIITVTGKGDYTGSGYRYFQIVPKKTTLSSVTAGTKKATLKYTKVSGVTGYEIYRATSKTGTYTKIKTTSATSFANTGLTKGKTYYYKVRTYKTVNGVKYYSAYSAVKYAKAK